MSNTTEYCNGCTRIGSDGNCTVYANPELQMRWVKAAAEQQKVLGIGCSFNKDNIIVSKKAAPKKRVGQQKQKKKR